MTEAACDSGFGDAMPVYACMYAIPRHKFNFYCLKTGDSSSKYKARTTLRWLTTSYKPFLLWSQKDTSESQEWIPRKNQNEGHSWNNILTMLDYCTQLRINDMMKWTSNITRVGISRCLDFVGIVQFLTCLKGSIWYHFWKTLLI